MRLSGGGISSRPVYPSRSSSMKRSIVGLACALFAGPIAIPAQADTDACSLITAGQVSAAAGFAVGPGSHVTPTFVKTCTWNATGAGGVQTVTLNLQAGSFFDGAKRTA